jgi:hypothetical protein
MLQVVISTVRCKMKIWWKPKSRKLANKPTLPLGTDDSALVVRPVRYTKYFIPKY